MCASILTSTIKLAPSNGRYHGLQIERVNHNADVKAVDDTTNLRKIARAQNEQVDQV